jgi:hypothetical protein
MIEPPRLQVTSTVAEYSVKKVVTNDCALQFREVRRARGLLQSRNMASQRQLRRNPRAVGEPPLSPSVFLSKN